MNTGIIYIIKCKDPKIEQCYIGSTTNLKRRKREHKKALNDKTKNKNKLYTFIKKNKGFDNFFFEILQDEIEFNNKNELRIIERFHIEDISIKLTLNTEIPSRTVKEYRKEYSKIYRQKNKDIINNKKNIKIICECGTIASKSNISQHKKSKKHINFINQPTNNG